MADLPIGQVGNVAETAILGNQDHNAIASSSQPSPGGSKVFFVMVAQLVATLGWDDWTVPNAPDATGALYPGGPAALIAPTIHVGSQLKQ